MKQKRYSIHGSQWVLRELTFDQDFELRQAISGKFQALDSAPPDQSLVEWIWRSGILESTFQVILRPYEPTIIHRLWNRLACRWSGVDPRRNIGKMTNSQILQILADFFYCNEPWMGGFLRFASGSGSMTDLLKTLSATVESERLTKSPSSSPEETSKPRPGL